MKIYKVSKWIIVVAITAIFILGLYNFISINNAIEGMINNIESQQYSENCKDVDINIYELQSVKKGIFDANTITFLVCFSLALLFTLIFTLQDRLIKQVQLVKDIQVQTETGKFLQQYYTRIHCIYCGSVLVNYILASESYIIKAHILTTVYTINREVLSLLKDFPESRTLIKDNLNISQEDRDAFIEVIRDTIHLLDLTEVYKKAENKGATPSIEDLIDNLKSLEYRIKNIADK